MKTSLKTLSLSLFIIIVMSMGTFVQAQDVVPGEKPIEAPKPTGKTIPEDLTADFNLSLYSQYIWRGYELSRGSVVFFPTLTVGYKGFAVNIWTDLDTRCVASQDKDFKLQETDVTVSYSNSYKPWKLNYTVGWILYDYQATQGTLEAQAAENHFRDTKNQEFFLSLGLDTFLKPTFTVYNEIEIGQAWYMSLALSHSIAVYKDWSLDLAGWVSYYSKSTGSDGSDGFGAFHDGNISAGLKIPINNFASIKPNIQYSFPLSGGAAHRIERNSFSGHNNFVYGGLIFDLAI
ncbi:MAG: hypothetical protein VB050_06760 [Geobacteraceae bacterium]|nr:hypothetical protein [Geobacteraceae bacterium]